METLSCIIAYDHAMNSLVRFDRLTGSFIDRFVSLSPINPLFVYTGLEVGSSGDAFVSSYGRLYQYRIPNGALLAEYDAPDFIVGPLAGITSGPDGNLYVAHGQWWWGYPQGGIAKFDLASGVFTPFVKYGSGDLRFPHAMAFGPDGNLYVGGLEPGNISYNPAVYKFDGNNGDFLEMLISPQNGGLKNLIDGLAFSPDGKLYLSNDGRVLRYNGSTGALDKEIIARSAENQVSGLRFGPDGNLYVCGRDKGRSGILQYDTEGLFLKGFFLPPPPGFHQIFGLFDPWYLAFAEVDFVQIPIQPRNVSDILWGIIQDGGGALRHGGQILTLPPRPGPMRDILPALAMYEIATSMADQRSRGIKSALLTAIQEASEAEMKEISLAKAADKGR